ncbi:MAG: hypothetical protein ABIP48_22525 [Planctomycetota bacterium]
MLPESPQLLIQLARERYSSDEHATLRRMLARRAESLIERMDLEEDERYHLRGSLLAVKERYPEAIAGYSRAVELRPEELRWRYELALLLKHEDKFSEAHEQAKLCAVMEPGNKEYRTLLKEIIRTRLTTAESME